MGTLRTAFRQAMEPLGNAVSSLPVVMPPNTPSPSALVQRLGTEGAEGEAAKAQVVALLHKAAMATRGALATSRQHAAHLLHTTLVVAGTRQLANDQLPLLCSIRDLMHTTVLVSHTGSANLGRMLAVDGTPPCSIGVQGQTLLPWVWYTVRNEAGVQVHMPVSVKGWERLRACRLLSVLAPDARFI